MAEDTRRESLEHDEHRKLQRAKQHADGEHADNGPGELQAPDSVPSYPPSLLADVKLSGRGNGPVRTALMRQMQQTYGNRATQRYIQRQATQAGSLPVQRHEANEEVEPIQRTPSVIKEEGEEDRVLEEQPVQTMRASSASLNVQRKPEVDALTTDEEKAIKPLMTGSAKDKQDAIDAVAKAMVAKGDLSLDKLQGKKVYYDASTSGEGLTSTNFDKGKPTPSKLTMGDAAFASIPWLYSSILHEYQHVKQHQALAKPGDFAPQSDKFEVEAYAAEIINANRTGVINDKAQMEDLWKRLYNNYYKDITDDTQKKALKSLITQAHGIVEKATGKTFPLDL
jgi:hypothetical protein